MIEWVLFALDSLGLYEYVHLRAPTAITKLRFCRMAMVEVERAVQALTEGESAEEQGLLMFRLATVYEEAIKLYRSVDIECAVPPSFLQSMYAQSFSRLLTAASSSLSFQ